MNIHSNLHLSLAICNYSFCLSCNISEETIKYPSFTKKMFDIRLLRKKANQKEL